VYWLVVVVEEWSEWVYVMCKMDATSVKKGQASTQASTQAKTRKRACLLFLRRGPAAVGVDPAVGLARGLAWWLFGLITRMHGVD